MLAGVSLLLLLPLVGCTGDAPSPSESAAEHDSTEHASAADNETSSSDPTGVQEAPPAPPDSATQARFDTVMTNAQSDSLHTESLGRIMQALGQQFMGAPYLEHTLDTTPTERLVTRLDGFDCVTFVEAMLAMGRGVSERDYSFDGYAERLQAQRYRGDAETSYCARLHYFSEWIADNQRRGVVRDVTADLGGERIDRTLTFMSEHRDAYDRFATNDSLYACVQDMEAELRAQDHAWHVIPQDEIDAVADEIEAGDIIGLATDIAGLDIAHTGLAFRDDDGQLGLLHASLSGEVVVSPDIQQYVQQIDHQIGIVVARPVAP